MRRELEFRPLVLALAGLLLGMSLPYAWWHPLAAIPLVLWLQRKSSRVIVVASVVLGLWLAPPVRPAYIFDRASFVGEVDVLSVPITGRTYMTAIGMADGKRYVLRLAKSADVSMGDRIEIRAQVMPLPEGGGYVRGAIGSLRPVGKINVLSRGSPWWRWGLVIRRSFSGFIHAHMADRPAGIVDALCFNTTADLTSDDYTALRRTGTTHIISTSGIHVVITAWMMFTLLRHLPIPRHYQIGILIALLLVYAGAAGFRPPIVRAVVMSMVALSAYLAMREADGLSALAIAAIGYLILEPTTIMDIGFFLSVTAVAGLVMFTPVPDPGRFRLSEWIKSAVIGSFVASVATAPIIAYFFGEVALISVLANMLILPMVNVAIVAALLAWLTSSVFPPLAVGLLAGPVTWCAEGLLATVHSLSAWPGASIALPAFSPYWMIPIYAGFVLLWRPHVRPA